VRIEALVADGIRNLQSEGKALLVEPHARFNVFVGDNGQGKTNLLEAIFVVATLRSFRTSKLTDLIAFGRTRATLGARVLKDDLTRLYEVELEQAGPGKGASARRAKLDGKVVRPLSRYFGAFNVVVFTPEDLAVPRGSPGDRRRFLDRSVFTLDPTYLATAADYDKVLRTRNAVLKRAGQGPGGRPAMSDVQLEDLLAVYDQQLATLAIATIEARTRFVARLAPELRAAFAAITRTPRVAGMHYEQRVKMTTVDEVLEQLRLARAKDRATCATQVGPHRDEVVLELDGRDAGSFASQGQLRAIMLAWKTAELQILGRVHGDLPILLLDDVSSELDASRNEFLFEHLAKLAGQCFITTTDGGHVLVREDRADYRIQNGRISQ
jgi:DNA replication and repair protein RecF